MHHHMSEQPSEWPALAKLQPDLPLSYQERQKQGERQNTLQSSQSVSWKGAP